MSNWDLMMPGMGLTAIGLTGVTLAYAGIAHTFVDGMHALTGLTMIIGLIFLSAGILEGGVSTSNRAKATTLVILGIAFSFGLAALNFVTVTTIPTFAGVMLIIAVPSIVMAYVTMKMPQYAKPISVIFIIAVGAAVASYVGFGLYGPTQYLVPPQVTEPEEAPPSAAPSAPVFPISILKGSSTQGNPDYDPDVAQVPLGDVITWTNNDDVAHTVTSAADAGATFDSSLINPGGTYSVDTNALGAGTYEYMCIVHPWMQASFVVGGGGAAAAPKFDISILAGSSVQGNPDFEPDPAEVPVGSTIVWTNNDNAAHTVTSSADSGDTFDSSLISPGDTFTLDTSKLTDTKYDYMCIVHPFMTGTFELVQPDMATVQEPTSLETSPETVAPSETTPEVTPEPPVGTTPETPVTTPETPAETSIPPATPQIKEEDDFVAQNTVSIPAGSSSPGCEEENQCFVPYAIKVSAGTTVTWTNDDTAAHTVTSGVDGSSDGMFDSSLLPAGKSFAYTFQNVGEYQYFCQVHPWMKGSVRVE